MVNLTLQFHGVRGFAGCIEAVMEGQYQAAHPLWRCTCTWHHIPQRAEWGQPPCWGPHRYSCRSCFALCLNVAANSSIVAQYLCTDAAQGSQKSPTCNFGVKCRQWPRLADMHNAKSCLNAKACLDATHQPHNLCYLYCMVKRPTPHGPAGMACLYMLCAIISTKYNIIV